MVNVFEGVYQGEVEWAVLISGGPEFHARGISDAIAFATERTTEDNGGRYVFALRRTAGSSESYIFGVTEAHDVKLPSGAELLLQVLSGLHGGATVAAFHGTHCPNEVDGIFASVPCSCPVVRFAAELRKLGILKSPRRFRWLRRLLWELRPGVLWDRFVGLLRPFLSWSTAQRIYHGPHRVRRGIRMRWLRLRDPESFRGFDESRRFAESLKLNEPLFPPPETDGSRRARAPLAHLAALADAETPGRPS